MNPVQNQGCGDCWAFAGVGAVEAAWVFGNIELIVIHKEIIKAWKLNTVFYCFA